MIHEAIAVGTGRIRVWDLPLRIFHWSLVVAIAIALLSAEEESALNQWHVMAGWIAGILVVFRVAWGFVGGEHSRFASFVRPSALSRHVGELVRGRPEPTVGHNALGALSVLLLLLLVAGTVWTGIILAEDLHELLGWTLLGLVAIHVVAVILMSLLTRENLVGAMVTGAKPAARHVDARDARRPGLLGLLVAILVIAGAAYAVLVYDPLAFTPRTAESYEHRADAPGGEGAAGGEAHEDGREAND